MAFEVVDRQQRLVRGHRQRFGADQPDHHPADQPRSGSNRDRIDIGQRHPGIGERGGDQRHHPFDMRARRDFRDHPAIWPVRVVLRGNVLGEDRAGVVHKRGGSLVARGFNAENHAHRDFP